MSYILYVHINLVTKAYGSVGKYYPSTKRYSSGKSPI